MAILEIIIVFATDNLEISYKNFLNYITFVLVLILFHFEVVSIYLRGFWAYVREYENLLDVVLNFVMIIHSVFNLLFPDIKLPWFGNNEYKNDYTSILEITSNEQINLFITKAVIQVLVLWILLFKFITLSRLSENLNQIVKLIFLTIWAVRYFVPVALFFIFLNTLLMKVASFELEN